MDKTHGFIRGAASGRYPVTHAIARSIDSHPDRVPQRLALGFADGNAASEDTWRVQRRIIGVRWYLRYFVLILRHNRIIFDAAGAVRRHQYAGAPEAVCVRVGGGREDLLHRQTGRAGASHISGLRARGDDDIVWLGYDDHAKT